MGVEAEGWIYFILKTSLLFAISLIRKLWCSKISSFTDISSFFLYGILSV